MQQITAFPDVSRPSDDEPKVLQRPGLEALQFRLSFNQLTAEAAKSKSGLVIAEKRSSEHAKQLIG